MPVRRSLRRFRPGRIDSRCVSRLLICTRLNETIAGRFTPALAQRDLRRVRTAADKVEKAQDVLRRAIVLAQQSGETVRDIAPYAGLSPSRIHQILREERRRQE